MVAQELEGAIASGTGAVALVVLVKLGSALCIAVLLDAGLRLRAIRRRRGLGRADRAWLSQREALPNVTLPVETVPQRLFFGWCRGAPQDCVAMGKSPEAGDHDMMAACEWEVLRQVPGEPCKARPLVGDPLAMHQRHTDELPLCIGKAAVPPARNSAAA